MKKSSFIMLCMSSVLAGVAVSCASSPKAEVKESEPKTTAVETKAETYVPPKKTLIYKFDFGANGAAEGFTAVSAKDAYSSEKGFGFAKVDCVQDVESAGTGEKADAVVTPLMLSLKMAFTKSA